MRKLRTSIKHIKEGVWRLFGERSLSVSLRGGLLTLLLAVVFVATPTHFAHASMLSSMLEWIGDTVGGVLQSAVGTVLFGVLNGILYFFTWLSAILLGIFGLFFDYAIWFTVIQNPIDSAYAGIVVGWTIMRDFANLAFIFILVYIGVMTMIDAGGFGMKKMLTRLIVIALLINFSFFLTRFVIDISNIVAFQIYRGIAPQAVAAGSPQSLGVIILSKMGNEKLFQYEDLSRILSSGPDGTVLITVRLALNLVTAWVLLQMCFLFVARLVAFVFLIVLSPAAFMASILPGTQSYFKEWKETLIGQAVVAPLFMFFLLVIVNIMTAMQSAVTVPAAQVANVGDISEIFLYTLAALLLLRALKVAKKFSGEIGATVSKWGNIATGIMAGGAVGFVGRQTLGRAALGVSRSEGLKEAGKETGIKGYMARQVLRRSEGVSKSTMDLRNSSRVAKLGLGKGSKSTYAGLREKNEKYYEQQAKMVGTSAVGAKDIDGRTFQSYRKEIFDADEALTQADTNYNKAVADHGIDSDQATEALRKKNAARVASDKLNARRAHVKELEAITDDYKRAEKIAEVRGKERAVSLMTARTKEAAPGAPGISSKYFAAMGWNAPAYSASRNYFRNASKSKREKALDMLREVIPDDDKPATPPPAAPPSSA